MTLSPGDKLGPDEILAPVGKGGMGEVYRAKDSKLDREVAIKVLPSALAQDPERLARFEREAKVLASLNHPNIAQIYGIEESSTGRALVMELVPGETLKGPLPLGGDPGHALRKRRNLSLQLGGLWMGIWLLVLLALFSNALQAQWLNFSAPNIPRDRDGKPNLTARAPRAGGKPDLSGLWQTDGPPPAVEARLFPNGNGGDEIPSQYFINILFDFGSEEILTPSVAAQFRQRAQNTAFVSPLARCLPSGLPIIETVPQPYKIIQTPGLIAMLYERDTVFRQIHLDGRKLPIDPQPSWLGYSVGRWEGDTLVVDTVGLTDQSWLDARGHTHSDQLKITERFARKDFGHMEVTMTLTDPRTFTRPVTIVLKQTLHPDTEVLENFCNENERDVVHMGTK